MRPLYLLLKLSLTYSFRLFYKKQVVINGHREMFGSTIYVSNHPNSFMDPLLIGVRNRPVVFFMARSDVFKWWLKPIVWAAHMLPIFRQHDGEDTKTANQDSFNAVNRSLAKGSNILIFGEGFTDDVPIRGLKPVKKGAVRMGFNALEAINWSKKIYLCALGINYTDRNTMAAISCWSTATRSA
jgi:1-acyl-sn-glycerol-3-phosphate acyltransferase